MGYFNKLSAGAAVATVLALTASAGLAAPLSIDDCGPSITYGLSQQGMALTAICGSPNEEGDTQYAPLNGWTLGADVDAPGEVDVGGNGNLALTISGNSWSLTNPNGYSELAIALKQGSTFAFYELDLTKSLSGMWGTSGPGQSSDGYSHINAWYKGDSAVIPLPAAGWLLLTSLGGLVALRRRKS